MLNNFLAGVKEYSGDSTPLARILTADDMESLDTIQSSTEAPVVFFTSPFEGITLAQVNDIFAERIGPVKIFTKGTFIVLDQRTLQDESCLILSGAELFEPENERHWLRTDFSLSLLFVLAAELGVTDLGEGLSRDTVWGIHNMNLNTLPLG